MMQVLEKALLLPRLNVYPVGGTCWKNGHQEDERGDPGEKLDGWHSHGGFGTQERGRLAADQHLAGRRQLPTSRHAQDMDACLWLGRASTRWADADGRPR